jgi:hypothetical protein
VRYIVLDLIDRARTSQSAGYRRMPQTVLHRHLSRIQIAPGTPIAQSSRPSHITYGRPPLAQSIIKIAPGK